MLLTRNISKYRAYDNLLDFMRYTWQKPQEPMKIGLHTLGICSLLDKAFEDYNKGISTFLIIKVHFRAGKSDIISRYSIPYFLGKHPDNDVMLVTYASSLAEGFSRFNRNLVRSEQYQDIFSSEKYVVDGGVEQWGFEGHNGVVTASGISSGITGKGYVYGITDDYLSSRASAESQTIRDTLWEHFTNDFLTRRAPVSITVVLATPWHVDDIIGRIEQCINPESEKYNPDFPKFKVVSFPAIDGEVDIDLHDRTIYKDSLYHHEHIKYDYLFTDKVLSNGYKLEGRFSEEWYKQQFASLGSYAASALLQCNPQQKGGNLIDTSKIVFHADTKDFPQVKYYRFWDLAHTAKQTQKDDPDWTSGTLLAYTKVNGLWHLWIKDVARIRAKSPERNNFILAVTEKDGMNVPVIVENSLDSKDAVSDMQTILKGRRIVKPINIKTDKVARVGYIEPIFEAGNVHVVRADWNRDWLEEVKAFPSGKHDDQVDNLTAGYFECCQSQGTLQIGRVSGI